MARYIDLEEFAKRINENVKPDAPEEKALIDWCKDECIRQGYAMPAADVVPKSEVESLAKEVDRLSQCVLYNDGITQMLIEEAKEKVAREIFEEIEKILKAWRVEFMGNKFYHRSLVDKSIAELKRIIRRRRNDTV